VDQAYFLDLFYEVADRDPRIRVILFAKDKLGFITAEDIEGISRGLAQKDILICGPPPMIKSLRAQLTSRGIPAANIHVEEFGFANLRS